MAKLRRAETGMTLGEHLAELRQRLMIIFICVSVIAVLGFHLLPALISDPSKSLLHGQPEDTASSW